ncbi:MAG TPA: sulfite exporter TauE/SafE family protein [Myxococcaceae bacterium]|nr:sulfite exporter TauE/SafE family protein [Myxococcaceae bacterium]
MTPLEFSAILFGTSVLAGMLGALLGFGGGIIIVPILTLGLKVDIRYAIGASVVSVIATSSGAASAYVRDRLANLRVAMFLELATVTGALTGAYLTGLISVRALYVVFGVMLGYSALAMLRKMSREDLPERPPPEDALADRLALHGAYFDEATGRQVSYRVTGALKGLGMMYGAGVVSGLLGIGSGALKVPAMDLTMRLPIKVSTATSNLMIGVTAAASAGVYFARGDIDPFIAGPVAAGVVVGAFSGSRLLPRLQNTVLRAMFVAVLLWISVQMLLKGLR